MKLITPKLLISCLCLLAAQAVQANIGVLPSRIEGKIPPTKSYENVFTITNKAPVESKVKIMWRDRSINPVSSDWFSLAQEEVTLPAGGSVEVGYKINVPEGSSGEYNAWVIFTGEPIGNIMGANLSIRISIPVYISVRGTEKFDFDLKRITISNKENTEFKTLLHNTGNVHMRPTGTITIISEDNKTKYNMPFNAVEWAIIPNERGNYVSKFDEPTTLPDGLYSAKIHIIAEDEDQNKHEEIHNVNFKVTGITAEILETEESTDLPTEQDQDSTE
ncbi:MAG: hypothetical protein C4541_11275 [Candidatus Auribacter fodinae]|jgi:hypothetical protein|uniref:Molecular chaperone n=1 Tax=Candidatus Auribacter fodinae TaxID=2093366 RepID=A0A3A4QW08_9BACT|nr:MAG: hypothetical protein C4541_11275 [Candidatus Auribacter fodinae]